MGEPVREVFGIDGRVWACYARTGGKCFALEGVLCPHLPDYAERRTAIAKAAWLTKYGDHYKDPSPNARMLDVMAAIARTEDEISTRYPFSSADDCCHDCKYGGNVGYRRLTGKLHRQEAWLDVLRAKQCRDQVALKRAGERYGVLTAACRRRHVNDGVVTVTIQKGHYYLDGIDT